MRNRLRILAADKLISAKCLALTTSDRTRTNRPRLSDAVCFSLCMLAGLVGRMSSVELNKLTFDAAIRSRSWLPARAWNRTGHALWTSVAAGIEMLVIAVSSFGAFAGYNYLVYGAIPDSTHYGFASAAIGAVYGGLCLADNQYDLLGAEWNRHGRSRGLGAIWAAFVLLLAIGFISDNLKEYSRGTFFTQLLVASLAQLITRTFLWQVIREGRIRGNWLAPGIVMLRMPGVDGAADLHKRLSIHPDEILRSYELAPIASGASALERFDNQIAEIRRECRSLKIDAILISFDADNMELVTRAVSALSELPARIQLLPVGMADLMQRSRIGSCGEVNVFELFCGPCSLRDRLLKRSMDVVVAMAAGVLISPLLVLVAVLIKLDSKGPVLFRQTRHGFNNEPIQVLKFRTMTTCDDSGPQFRQVVRGDPRITRIGRFLRRTNIDELPQLINVFKGDMSIVGPRPHAVAHNEMYEGKIRGMWRRHNVKPGITGWAQVNGLRGETDTIEKMRERVEYDLYYVANWSLLFDLKIMIMTLSKRAHENAY
jgi:Undecaprenyl-phosphate glucose phosphotransferase